MKWALTIVLVIVGLALIGGLMGGLLTGCGSPTAQAVSRGSASNNTYWGDPLTVDLKLGEAAPDFSGVDVLTGKTISLKQFAGKPVLLNFVNYGCSTELNNIVSAQLLAVRQLTQQRSDFVPLSVFCGCCPVEVLRDFAKSNNLNWPWILDSSNAVIAKYSSAVSQFGYPTLIFVAKDGTISEVTGVSSLADLNTKLDKLTAVAPTY